MRRAILPLLILSLPILEIAGFAFVGREIGVLATIGLVLASGILGAVLLRWQGFGVLRRIRQDVETGRDPGRQLAHGVMILIAGVLLLIPGFITDIIGLLLFVPPVRDLGWRLVRSRVKVVGDFGMFRRPAPAERRGPVIDLDADDYSRARDPESPWRRLDDK